MTSASVKRKKNKKSGPPKKKKKQRKGAVDDRSGINVRYHPSQRFSKVNDSNE